MNDKILQLQSDFENLKEKVNETKNKEIFKAKIQEKIKKE